MVFVSVWVLISTVILGMFIVDPQENIEASATLITVDDDGTADYSTIQAAIDNASAGDTILVKRGIYYENVLVNKTINLTGEDKDTTIIDGGESWSVLRIRSDWVNVTEFTIQNNVLSSNAGGIELIRANYSNIYQIRAISNRGPGIYISESNSVTIVGNNISNNSGRGIYLIDSAWSHHLYRR